MKDRKFIIKNVIITLFCILFLILFIILAAIFFYKDNSQDDKSVNNVKLDDSSNQNKTNSNDDKDSDEEDDDIDDEEENTVINSEGNSKSQKITIEKILDIESYSIVKECLKKYYQSNYIENPVEILDKDVISEFNITNENYSETNNFTNPTFRIDEIYRGKVTSDQHLYYVSSVLENEDDGLSKSILWIRVDTTDQVFSIYPYEYLKQTNKLNMNAFAIESSNTHERITKTSSNTYEKEKMNDEGFMDELYERFKFDLMFDNEHLYNCINDKYKKIKYPNYEDLENYINDNKTDLYLDSLSEYEITSLGNGKVKYVGIGKSKNEYVFLVEDLMNYKISLDDYEIVQDVDFYNQFFNQAQAKDCVNRVIKAINNYDYDFVYRKLNPVPKNNYYKNPEDFYKFLDDTFYAENNYAIDDDYLIITQTTYQFKVKIDDKNSVSSSKTLTMTVSLEGDGEFTISIAN